MNKEQMRLIAGWSKVPGLPNIDHLIAGMSSATWPRAMDADFQIEPVLPMDIEIRELDFSTEPVVLTMPEVTNGRRLSMPIPSGTTSITIRVQNRVLAAMKAQASKKCVGYQTHINRVLKAAVAS